MTGSILRRPLGSTGEEVSLLAVGGARIGHPEEAEGIRIVQQAIEATATC
jgi:aryl-alcohol dehydrogenase-like predicted oxidoreductase